MKTFTSQILFPKNIILHITQIPTVSNLILKRALRSLYAMLLNVKLQNIWKAIPIHRASPTQFPPVWEFTEPLPRKQVISRRYSKSPTSLCIWTRKIKSEISNNNRKSLPTIQTGETFLPIVPFIGTVHILFGCPKLHKAAAFAAGAFP